MNCGLVNYPSDGVGDRDLLTASSRALSAPELGTQRVELTLPLFEPGRFSWLHDGIGVPVDDLPVTIFPAINLCDTQSEWAQFLTPLRLHFAAFDIDRVGQIPALTHRQWFQSSSSTTKMCRGPLKARLDCVPTLRIGARTTENGHVIGLRPQRDDWGGIAR